MLGWINDCIESLVIEKFGIDAWHVVKSKAGCDVKDGGFLKLEIYPDKSTYDLVGAASEATGLSIEQVLEAFGEYFVHYIRNEGYENLLCLQGRTFKSWMTNINAIHQHLQTTFPKKMTMPQFWCEDSEEEDGSLMLHYFSKRGNLLVPLAKGLVSEVAQFQFDVEIDMAIEQTQGVDGAKFTSWKISAKDPEQQWKLKDKEGGRDGIKNAPTEFKCPMTGMTALLQSRSSDDLAGMILETEEVPSVCPMSVSSQSTTSASNDTEQVRSPPSRTSSMTDMSAYSAVDPTNVGLSGTVTKKLFPYHFMVDTDFTIMQVGESLPEALKLSEKRIIGKKVPELFEITKPLGIEWTWSWLRRLEDQSFTVMPTDDDSDVVFKASAVHVSDEPTRAMLIMAPDANNLDDLRDMNLTLSDLPVHGEYRDAVFLREHLSTQMNSALRLEKLSKTLVREKKLLESLLPQHAAEGLRAGKTVEPMLHKSVTMFFSDIVGFTTICKQIYPWDVIAMLNRLYCVMDFLALRFKLYKVETIGDAYVCCSGLPESDDRHAENVANFAVAVLRCCKQVLSPVDDTPISLRIGIHTGPCASGVVGMTNPRYCVFGDTVNTTSRHESTGLPGRIHCSQTTRAELKQSAEGKFLFEKRGLVEMKGKGEVLTYWLEGSKNNELVNEAALQKLEIEVKDLLEKTDFNNTMDKESAKRSFDLESRIRKANADGSLSPVKRDRKVIAIGGKKVPEKNRSYLIRKLNLNKWFI